MFNDAVLIKIPNGIILINITKITLLKFEPLNSVMSLPDNELKAELNNPFSDNTNCHENTRTDSLINNGIVMSIKNSIWNHFEAPLNKEYETKNEKKVANKLTPIARKVMVRSSFNRIAENNSVKLFRE